MHADHPTNPLADAATRLEAATFAIDRLVTGDDPEISYAATTAALHLHAAQAELPALAVSDSTAPSVPGLATAPRQATDALATVIAFLNDRVATLPARQQTTAARVLLHLAEARDALTEAVAP